MLGRFKDHLVREPKGLLRTQFMPGLGAERGRWCPESQASARVMQARLANAPPALERAAAQLAER